MAGVCSALNKTMATTNMGIAVMGLERQVIAACGSAVCGDDLAMEVPAFGPAAAPVEASVVATSNRKRRAPSCPPGRPRLGFVAACSLAAAFLVVFAVDLALFATPAQAQTTVWSATLNPIITFSGTVVPLGCDNTSDNTRKCSTSARLSDDDFTDDGTDYAVVKFVNESDGDLIFRLDTGATAATQGLTLVIDGTPFVLNEADRINTGKTQWKWFNTNLGWAAGTDVAVSLVVTDAPATGQPTISGTAQVDMTLTAETDSIEDPDGLPTPPTFTYQWVRVDGSNNETILSQATSETYTLTTSDVGHTIKVEVSFTDSRGHAEGPLLSAAYPANGTVVPSEGTCPPGNSWCATMTAADAEGDGRSFGYEYDKFGSLDDDTAQYGQVTFNIFTVHTNKEASRDYFYIGADPELPLGTVITVGERMFTTDLESDDGRIADLWAFPPGELPADLVWMDGQNVKVSLTFPTADATLSGLTLKDATDDSAIDLNETFASGTKSYTADVASGVTSITVEATTTDSIATFAYLDASDTVLADADTNKTGFQVALAEGQNSIKVEVTAQDLDSTDIYAVVVNRNVKAPPTLSIADASAAENAGHLMFDVTLSRSLPNTVKVDFETISGGTAAEGEDYHARRKYTHVILAGDRTAQMGFALIEDTVAAAGETVKVKLSNARVVDAYGDKIKDLDITTDEATGTITAPTTTTTDVPGLTIGIRDATGDEDDGWLDFRVRLSRKYDDYVCYDFETISGGTATEGRDYLKIPKATYWMQIGKRVDKPFVRIIDDAVNDNGETVKVKISNAHLCDDASQTVRITRAEATGTINNSDPIPQAWLARFGRTVADQVLDAVEGRMTAPRAPGTELSVAGQRVGGGSAAAPVAVDTGEAEAGLEALAEWLRDEEDEDRTGFESRPVAGRDILTGSSFAFTEGSAEGGFGAVWGRGAISRFDGREGDLTLDGEVASAMVGADWTGGRGSAGLAVAHSRGEGDYRSPAGGGAVESTLTGVYPYGRYDVSERLSLWGVVGYGTGTLTLTPEGQAPIETDMDLSMAAVGGRSVVVKPPADGGLELAATADAMVVQTASDEVRGSAGKNLAASEAEVTRVRFGFEGTWRGIGTEGGGSLVPGFEIGVRQDGGDAETGLGVDIGAGLAWSDPAHGIAADVRARGLLTHEDGSFRERGFAGSFAWDPAPSSDLGPRFTLSQRVGASATGGMDALFGRETAPALGTANDEGDDLLQRRLETRFGYGFPLFGGRYSGTPEIGFGLTETGREYIHSWRLAEARSEGFVFGLDVEGTRRESVTDNSGTEHVIGFGLGWRLEGARREGFELRLEGSRLDAANDDRAPEDRIGLRMSARW